ncbi:glycosyltransferase [Rhodoplanes roseus]|nr:glycosyltransferase [Rhodoplanes roseus]
MFLLRKYRKLRAKIRNIRRTLDGTRFVELQAHLDAALAELKVTPPNPFATSHSVARLTEQEVPAPSALAVLSSMPPASTGIATCTLMTVRAARFPVDVFSTYATASDYLLGLTDRRLAGTAVRVFDITALPLALSRHAYRAQIVTLGNSAHHVEQMRQFRQCRRFPNDVPVLVHLHDPGLMYLASLVLAAEKTNFRDALWATYGIDPRTPLDHEELEEQGVCGLRLLFAGLGVRAFLVNSQAAAAMVRRELPAADIHVLFHPLLPSAAEGAVARPPGAFRIGNFGVPHPRKRTEVVTAAFRLVRERVPAARLVIAGYDAAAYAAAHGLAAEAGYEIHDAPTDETFDALIESVDIGVQLRERNRGESSGPFTRLLQAGKPVIVSDLGSFAEHRDVARMVDPGCGPEELAAAILDERSRATERRPAVAALREAHSPEAFCRRLDEIVALYAAPPAPPRAMAAADPRS